MKLELEEEKDFTGQVWYHLKINGLTKSSTQDKKEANRRFEMAVQGKTYTKVIKSQDIPDKSTQL